MITDAELDRIEEAEHDRLEAEWAAQEDAEAKAKLDGAKAVIKMIRARKLQTLGQVIEALTGQGYGDDIIADFADGHRDASWPASEVVLDIEANYL